MVPYTHFWDEKSEKYIFDQSETKLCDSHKSRSEPLVRYIKKDDLTQEAEWT